MPDDKKDTKVTEATSPPQDLLTALQNRLNDAEAKLGEIGKEREASKGKSYVETSSLNAEIAKLREEIKALSPKLPETTAPVVTSVTTSAPSRLAVEVEAAGKELDILDPSLP